MSKHKFLTTPIYYSNGKPHMGHAFTNMQTDIMVRMYSLLGYKTIFSTGVDEHGTKVQKKARENNVSEQEWVDLLVENFVNLNEKLNLCEHRFVRTTDERHMSLVQEIWMRLFANDDIYKTVLCWLGKLFETVRFGGWYVSRVQGSTSQNARRELFFSPFQVYTSNQVYD